jgi:LacI family transcriptional regulator
MHDLGYNRNEVARSLKVRHTKTIGIIAPELSNVFFMEVVESMERILAPMGYTMIIGSSNDSVAEEKRKLQVLIERNVDGLVVMPAGAEGDHFRSRALSHIPMVMVDRRIAGVEVDSVLTDNRYGVHQMVRALKAEGFKRIGFIGGNPAIHTAGERLSGFLDAMKECGLPLEEQFILHEGAMVQSAGRKLLQRALEQPDHPDAFFVANDSLHLGATSFAMEHLPQEVYDKLVFASFDFLDYAPLLKLCHYAVAQPLEKIGHEVATLLLKRLKGDMEGFPEHVMLKPEIKIMTANGGRQFDTETFMVD